MTAALVDLETGVRHWLERWGDTRGDIIPHRQRADQTRIEKYILPYFGRRSVTRITYDQVEEWVDSLRKDGVGASTIYATLMTLRQALDMAVAATVIQENPARGVRIDGVNAVKEVEADKVLSEDQLQAVLREMDSMYAPLVLLVARTGIKWEEATGLRLRDIDLDGASAVVGRYRITEQGGLVDEVPAPARETRRIPLPPDVVDSLRTFIDETKSWRSAKWDWLFLTKRDHRHPLRPNFNIHVWRPALRAAGVDERSTTFHSLRHTAAVQMIRDGVSVSDLSKILGHASEVTTRKMYRPWLLERDSKRRNGDGK